MTRSALSLKTAMIAHFTVKSPFFVGHFADNEGSPGKKPSGPSGIVRRPQVSRHLKLGQPPQELIATLARAVLREDAGFHAYQMLEAGVRQFTEWDNTDAGRHILIAVARYLAAHSPSERAALQTADIARRLMRGGELHQEAAVS